MVRIRFAFLKPGVTVRQGDATSCGAHGRKTKILGVGPFRP
jgi:hypothetical protein